MARNATADTLTVTGLDASGRGIVPDRAPVPLTLPGERVQETGDGLRLVNPSPDRVTPPCPAFGRCGGCSLQHMAPAAYNTWKVERVSSAFAAKGLTVQPDPMVQAPLASRRRAAFTARAGAGGIVFGYHGARSHDVVDVATCPALAPALAAALPDLRALAAGLATSAAEVRITATLVDDGIDVDVVRRAPPARKRVRARRTPQPATAPPMVPRDDRIVRITLDGETLFVRETPLVTFPGGAVALPPAAFLQASLEGEAALIAAVCAAVGEAKRVADLFCGVGTFALPLARTAAVLAVEQDSAALAALSAARRPKGSKPIKVQRRNLFHHPLSKAELAPFDAVVFDPPRAGAQAQAHALAESAVQAVVAVSCEPLTLARDCAILVAGGFTITQVLPVDQFVATGHIETVTVLRRGP